MIFRRLVQGAELFGALLLAFITALTFVTVLARYVFNVSVPDSFDIGRYALGVLIFWGIAAAMARDQHISVDIARTAAGAFVGRIVAGFAALVVLGFMAVFCWRFWQNATRMLRSGTTTTDLQIPLGLFQLTAWAGVLLGCVLLAVRIVLPRLARRLDDDPAAPSS